MKLKAHFIFLLSLLFCWQASAQNVDDLLGKWITEQKEKDEDFEMYATSTYQFNENGSFSENGHIVLIMWLNEGERFENDFYYSAAGTFSINRDILTYKYDPKAVNIKEGKSEMPGLMRTFFYKPLQNEMKKALRKPHSDRILELTPDVLRLISMTDKDAEEEVYHR